MLNRDDRDGMKALAMQMGFQAMMNALDDGILQIHLFIADGRHGDAHLARLELEQMLQDTMDLVEDATIQLSAERRQELIERAIEAGYYARPDEEDEE